MKKFIQLFLLLIVFATTTWSQKMPELVVGNILNYRVINGDMEYSFVATITNLTDGISFSWTMSDPVNEKGTITITKDALKKATRYSNYFSPGDKILTEESSVFLSEANYKQLKSKKKTSMDMRDGNNGVWEGGCDQFNFIYKGVDVYPSSWYLGFQDNNDNNSYKEVVVIAEGRYHLILSMTLGWSIRLMSVE